MGFTRRGEKAKVEAIEKSIAEAFEGEYKCKRCGFESVSLTRMDFHIRDKHADAITRFIYDQLDSIKVGRRKRSTTHP